MTPVEEHARGELATGRAAMGVKLGSTRTEACLSSPDHGFLATDS